MLGAATGIALDPGRLVDLQDASAARALDRQLAFRGAARSVTGMAAILAHEVKNPLSGIRGAAQLLEPSVDPQDRVPPGIERCLERRGRPRPLGGAFALQEHPGVEHEGFHPRLLREEPRLLARDGRTAANEGEDRAGSGEIFRCSSKSLFQASGLPNHGRCRTKSCHQRP